jgi:hypothetical protein
MEAVEQFCVCRRAWRKSEAKSLLAGGNGSPNSIHFNDQSIMYQKRTV